VAENPERITVAYLNRFPEFVEFLPPTQSLTVIEQEPVLSTVISDSPDDLMETG
jgi:hypothetical protein